MCGSGTVLSIAAGKGHHAIGFDVDPLAVLMSNVGLRTVDKRQVAEAAAGTVARARRLRSNTLPWDDAETRSFAEYWFGSAQRTGLARLSRAISEVECAIVRDVLNVAMSRIIVTKSPRASLAADTAHSRPHRVIEDSNYDVYTGYEKSVVQLLRLLGDRQGPCMSSAQLGDARSLELQASTVDLVVTSPPYLNAIDYLRGHRLALIWLGYSLETLRSIRSSSIGAERAPDSSIEPAVATIVDAIQRLVVDPSVFPRSIVERYAVDLTLFTSELSRVCRSGARVVVVIGNSTLRGNFIRNDLLVGRALRGAGFEMTSSSTRDLPESKRYLPVSPHDRSSPIARRMRTEVVLNARKPA